MSRDADARISVLAETFKLLGDPTRLKILVTCLDAPIAVSDIAEHVGASPSLVSHHLRLLRAARLVRFERRNKQVFYEADDGHVREMVRLMLTHTAEEHADL
jgi:DNA-binding transcriptional ArsR family regulator